jgi:hypothetical protein
VIEHCPLCHGGRLDPDAIKWHNLRCAETGERAYPERHRPLTRRPLTPRPDDWQR